MLSLFQCSLSLALSLDGVTRFGSILKLNAAVPGVVKGINVKPAQRVSKGQLLLELDSTPYQAKLDKARATEQSLLPDVEIAQLELERVQELFDIDSLSQVDLMNAKNRLIRAQGHYQVARAESMLASYHFDLAMIRAPVDGLILQLSVNLAEHVDPSQRATALVTMVESQRMIAVGMLDTNQWNSALLNRPASVEYRGQTYKGRVSYLAMVENKRSGEKPGYAIHISFETDQLIPAGMPVSLVIKD
jgi:RND family efflux transporter MFP subunit